MNAFIVGFGQLSTL